MGHEQGATHTQSESLSTVAGKVVRAGLLVSASACAGLEMGRVIDPQIPRAEQVARFMGDLFGSVGTIIREAAIGADQLTDAMLNPDGTLNSANCFVVGLFIIGGSALAHWGLRGRH